MMKTLFTVLVALLLTQVGNCADVVYETTFNWTAVGDNGMEGTADHYEIYYSNDSLNLITRNGIEYVNGLPSPSPSGTPESYTTTITLQDGTMYWFRLRVYDEAGNFSESNIISKLTPDRTKPGPVTLQINFMEL